MSNYTLPMDSDKYYHVYNRTNNKERLFREEEDRIHFLHKCKEYLLPYTETFAYCLMGNHFHLLIRIKSITEIEAVIEHTDIKKRTSAQREFINTEPDLRVSSKVISSQFNRLFTAYVMYFNRKYKRNGNLFYRPFKRLEVLSEKHFIFLIYYIHANSKHHGIQNNFKNYKWSSYRTILSDKPTKLNRKIILEWFGGKAAFEAFHNQTEINLTEVQYLMIEDD